MKHPMLLALPLLIAAPVTQAGANPAKAADLKWSAAPPVFPKGAEMAVVKGDPGKAGEFTVELKFPANYTIPAHHHPTDEHVKVVSGKVLFGMGDKADKAKAKWMATGATGTAPAKMNHFVFTDAPAVVEVTAVGPFAMTYANPKDDPRK